MLISVDQYCCSILIFKCTRFLFSFFQDGLKAVDNLKPSIEKLATDLHTVRKSAAPVSSFLSLIPTFMHYILIYICIFLLCSSLSVFLVFPK